MQYTAVAHRADPPAHRGAGGTMTILRGWGGNNSESRPIDPNHDRFFQITTDFIADWVESRPTDPNHDLFGPNRDRCNRKVR